MNVLMEIESGTSSECQDLIVACGKDGNIRSNGRLTYYSSSCISSSCSIGSSSSSREKY